VLVTYNAANRAESNANADKAKAGGNENEDDGDFVKDNKLEGSERELETPSCDEIQNRF